MAGNTIEIIYRHQLWRKPRACYRLYCRWLPSRARNYAADLQPDLDRRKPGQSRYTTQRREDDEVQILSGVFEGKTTGTAIGMIINNKDQKSKDYGNIKDLFRPSHADYTSTIKSMVSVIIAGVVVAHSARNSHASSRWSDCQKIPKTTVGH